MDVAGSWTMARKAGTWHMISSRNNPKVSVLMCVYNGENYLPDAIESILSQSFEDFEFVIVDDGSNKNTKDLLALYQDPRIVFITNPENIGLTKSLNIGLSHCRGEYIARMDGDDISHPKRLEKQVLFLDEHSEIAVLGTQIRQIDEAGKNPRLSLFKKGTTPLSCRWQSIFDSPITHSSAMFRREIIVNELDGYDEEFRTSQDYELWIRILRYHKITNLDETLVDFRSHDDSVSKKYSIDNILKVAKILQNNLDNFLGLRVELSDFGLNWVTVTNSCMQSNLLVYKNAMCQLTIIYNLFSSKYLLGLGKKERAEICGHIAEKVYLISYAASDGDKLTTFLGLIKILKLRNFSLLLRVTLLFIFGASKLRNVKNYFKVRK
jgi:glycosyltransferase involved in cell wall biosynthesis